MSNVNPGAIFALLIVLFALGAAVLMGNMDASSPALAFQELKQGAPGAATSTIIFNQIVSVLLGILVTGLVGGVGSILFFWARGWIEERQKPDWEPGPNAGWKRRNSKPQGLSRDELFQMALLNMMSQNSQRGIPQIQAQPEPPEDYGEF